MASFIFGGNTGETAESVKRKRALAEQLLGSRGAPRNVGEGLTHLGKSLAGAFMARQAGEAEKTGREGAMKQWSDIFGPTFNDGLDNAPSSELYDIGGELGEKPMGTGAGSVAARQPPTVQQLAALLGNDFLPKGQSAAASAMLAQALQGPKDTRTQQERLYEAVQANPALGEWLTAQKRAGAPSVSVSGGTTYDIGSIPPGYRAIYENGVPVGMEALEGGPAAASAAEAQAADETRTENTMRAADVVTEDVGRLRNLIKESRLPVTGVVGRILSAVPQTGAYDANALVETIAGNIGMDRLQQMRDASKTGGALGAINQSEMTMLKAAIGNLDLGQSDEQILRNLERIDEIYGQIMKKAAAYPNAAEFGFGGGPSSPSTAPKRRRYNPETGEFD